MLLTLDHDDSAPLYEQLAAAVRRALASGELADGERLPSARDLALQLDVNMHTVLRAYAVLGDEGLLKVRRGRGAVVVSNTPALLPSAVTQAIERLVAVANRHHVPQEQLIQALKRSS